MTRAFNVVRIQPPGYVHALALEEAAEYLHHNLLAHGQRSQLTVNHVVHDARNVILCAHLLGHGDVAQLPADSIIFNSEQLGDRDGWHFASGVYQQLLDRFHVWDYAHANLARIPHDRKAVIPFAACDALVRTAIARGGGDALVFYGVLTDRRRRILDELRDHGIAVVAAFGRYGAARDREMFAARAVLNLHKSDDASVFEPIRCFYPLINQVPVISEASTDPTADAFRDAMWLLPRERFAVGLARVLADPGELQARTRRFASTSAHDAFARAIAGLDG
ncbi:MAG: hypothetical protein ABIY55_01145 [Kofleriaceae bacterium]